ncbi:MAG: 16S rRNA (guanine(527)-N(7))-methyltransferase RsmG [Tessaracoccus sp.]|uniref:16S rRNA (guanine(527)-N(7))-methyltransferase RsmG n=1 Tax=Tessaracoccus sp. TaxID=1971211 RepID=UPI001EC748C8|nr:16S rRNA (guanine(527)-N(7))-methyltransferase RsmG [Tessaracoccus sp.]MBK7822165.1 16S rRNA (guanine(527)-N(7))-methyltransferase RsmG [Tessaracoccus sp.]
MQEVDPRGVADETSEAELEAQAQESIEALYPDVGQELNQYIDILANRGMEWGLLGPREGGRLWQRHVANSLALVDLIGTGLDIADVGSGAGLPGLPLAIVRPDLRVTLIEPLLRRSNFLQLAVDELGLGDRVDVRRARAEECKQTFDVVVCRAVAPLDKLLKWTTPLFGGGQLVALKGESAEDEIRSTSKKLAASGLRAEVLELQVAPGVGRTRAIRVVARNG